MFKQALKAFQKLTIKLSQYDYEKYEARTGQPHINDWLRRQSRGR